MKINTYVEFSWSEEDQLYKEVYSESEEHKGSIALCKGGKGGGGGGTYVNITRYAHYVETHHASFLDTVARKREELTGGSVAILSFVEWYRKIYAGYPDNYYPENKARIDAEYQAYLLAEIASGGTPSPFVDYRNIEVDSTFFGVGYLISTFPSLYDMYGKFMAGLDIETLFSQVFEDTVNAPVINALVAAEAALLDDDIKANTLPRFQTGMRDINAVMSSSYVIGKAMIEDARVKSVSKFSAALKYQMIPVAVDRWKTHLDWNKNVVMNYAELMKLYYSAKMDITDLNYSMAAKDKLWPFTVLEFERAALGALQGATTTQSDVAGSSKAGKAIGGALAGAATGAMVGAMMTPPAPYVGAIIGGVIGLAGGLLG